jgi:hypothetical protein
VLIGVSRCCLRWAWLWLALGGGCAHHVRLVVPHTTGSGRYDCSADKPVCVPATHDMPADAARSGTAFVVLPAQCHGRIHEVLVRDADSPSPQVTVTCAPIENAPIEEMR